MLGKMIVNTITATLILYNTYNAYKLKDVKELKKHYNTYFIVISILVSIDMLFSFVTQFFPFYQLVKLCAVIWLSIPLCNGSVFIYKFYITPLLKCNEKKVDEFLERAKNVIIEKVLKNYNYAYSVYVNTKRNKLTAASNESIEVCSIDNVVDSEGIKE